MGKSFEERVEDVAKKFGTKPAKVKERLDILRKQKRHADYVKALEGLLKPEGE